MVRLGTGFGVAGGVVGCVPRLTCTAALEAAPWPWGRKLLFGQFFVLGSRQISLLVHISRRDHGGYSDKKSRGSPVELCEPHPNFEP